MELEMKTQKCGGCRTMRTPSSFIYKQKKNKTCGNCFESRKKFNEKNKEKAKEYRKANKDKIKDYKADYYEANKDKIKAHNEANKDKIKDYRKEYYEKIKKENPLLYKLKRMICNSIKYDIQNDMYNETNYVDMEHLFKLMEIQSGCCVYCGLEMLVDDFTQSKDGVSIQRIDNSKGHIKTNCIMSCLNCNITRKEKGKPAEFYQHILDEL